MQKLHLKDIVSQGSKKTNTQTWLSIGLAKLAGFSVSSVKCSATERQMTQGEAAAGQFWLQEATVFLKSAPSAVRTDTSKPPSLPARAASPQFAQCLLDDPKHSAQHLRESPFQKHPVSY